MARKASMPTISNDWEVQEDLRVIRRAEEIKASSKRMSAVKALASKELQAIQKAVGVGGNAPARMPAKPAKKR